MKNGYILIFTFLLMFSIVLTTNAQVIQADRDALIDLYIDTGGHSWTDHTNWNTAAPVSDWFGVTVVGNRVTGISLVSNNLMGDVPSSLNDLTALTNLDLTTNQLTSIPEIDNLVNLQTLRLTNNNLTNLPSLGNLTALLNLRVENNNLTSLPSLNGLTNLNNLHAQGNDLTDLPSLGDLGNLVALNISHNQINMLPSLSSLTSLRFFYLNHNELTEIPELGNLTALEYLYIFNNQLITLPNLNNLTALFDLRLYNNQLTTLSSLTNLTALQDLLVHNNNLIELPNLNSLTALQFLSIQNNQLTAIPSLNNSPLLNTVRCENNFLTFTDLAPILTLLSDNDSFTFDWFPQNPSIPIQGPRGFTYDEAVNNPPVTLSIELDDNNTAYQWQKDAVDLSGETGLSISFLASPSVHTYEVVTTHPDFTGSIISLPHTLVVNGIDEEGGRYHPYQLIVEFDDEAAAEAADANSLAAQFGAKVVDRCDCTKILQVWEFCDLLGQGGLTHEDGEALYSNDINEIKNNGPPEETCIDNYSFNYYTNSDSMEALSIPIAKPKSTASNNGPTSLRIAIIDSGYKSQDLIDHGYEEYYREWSLPPGSSACELLPLSTCDAPDLIIRDCEREFSGYNFIDSCEDPDNPMSNNEHATQMAAIIMNQLPAPASEVELMNLKAFDSEGKGSLFDAICAIYFASKYEADMINLSWSYQGQASSSLGNALDRALQSVLSFPNPTMKPILIFASAGNGLYDEDTGVRDGQDLSMKKYFPAAHHLANLVTVAATNGNELTPFSNYSNSIVEVAAPGWDIETGLGGTNATGTSPATAFVTGMAAAYWCHNFNEISDPQEVVNALQTGGVIQDMGEDGGNLIWGGRLDELMMDVQLNSLSCPETGTGTVTLQVKGGIGPYQYGSTTFENDLSFDLSPALHTIVVSDKRGVEVSTVIIPDPIFEQKLIDEGIDSRGLLDGLITSEDAQGVTGVLNINEIGNDDLKVNDLTGIGAFANITELICDNNNLRCLYVPPNVQTLNCSYNQISDLILSSGLEVLDCSHNELTEMSFPSTVSILNCSHNQLSALNVPAAVQVLDCSQNNVQSLDLSRNNISFIDCSHNSLTEFNIKNGQHLSVMTFNSTNNPDLLCISVDDVVYSTANWTDRDSHTSFSTHCGDWLVCHDWKEVALGEAVGTATFNECGENSAFSITGTADQENNAITDNQLGAYRPVCGDGEVIIQPMSTAVQFSGIELRETLDAGAKKVVLTNRSSTTHWFIHRSADNTAQSRSLITPIFNRKWFRIKRQGNQFSFYTSTNGTSWVIETVKTIVMQDCIELGLIAYAENSSAITVNFDNLWIAGFTTPSVNTTTFNFAQTATTIAPGTTVNVCVDINEVCGCNISQVDVRLSDNSSATPHLSTFSPTTLFFDGASAQACFDIAIDDVPESATYELILENPRSKNFAEIGTMGSMSIQVIHNDTELCMDDIVLTETIDEGLAMFLDLSITSTATINAPAEVTYQAVNEITLNPGFTVNVGATFTAFCSDEGCDNQNNNLVAENNNDFENHTNKLNKWQALIDLNIYPSPLSQTATITFSIPEEEQVSIAIYNHLGRLVKTVVTGATFLEGQHELLLEADDMPNGLYYCVLQARQFKQSKKMLVLHGH